MISWVLDFEPVRWFDHPMIEHTMIVSFDAPIPDADLDQFLSDIEKMMRDAGHVQTYAAQRHIRIPGDDRSPVFTATAIIKFGFADIDALNAAFALPDLEEHIQRWQARYPYKVVWANHAPLA